MASGGSTFSEFGTVPSGDFISCALRLMLCPVHRVFFCGKTESKSNGYIFIEFRTAANRGEYMCGSLKGRCVSAASFRRNLLSTTEEAVTTLDGRANDQGRSHLCV
jgi:hypothetical protein